MGEGLNAIIDVLAPSYTGKHEANQQHGTLVVDEIPGLGYALVTTPVRVEIEARLTTGSTVRTMSHVPASLPALCLKLLSWDSRLAAKDAEDIWRLLAVCHAAGVRPDDWPDSATPREALRVLKRFAVIDSTGLRPLTYDRVIHASIRALGHAVGGV